MLEPSPFCQRAGYGYPAVLDLLSDRACAVTGAFGTIVTSSSIATAARCAWAGPLDAVATQNLSD